MDMLYVSTDYKSIGAGAAEKVIILPLGAIEQHGPHLAVSTDTDIVTMVAMGAEEQLADMLVLCPTLVFGSSHHHLNFGGTLSLSPALYTQVVVDLVSSLLQNGFRRIVLLNGHGGNITPVKQALALLNAGNALSREANIVLATYWELAGAAFTGEPPMESPALSHACEYETSLMLHLFPSRVFMDKVERADRPASNGYTGWEDDEPYRGVTIFKGTEYISSNGSSGEPQLATAEKGAHLYGKAVGALVKFLKAFAKWPFLPALGGGGVAGATAAPAADDKGPRRISAGTATGAYSSGVVDNGLLFVSGQGSLDPATGQVVHGTIEEETLLTLENIKRIVETAGGTVRDIVKCTVHLSDINDFDRYNKAYASFFGGVFPARTTVQSVLGDGLKVEIDAVAVINK
jgi:creatinine amidohydrolase